MGIKFLIDDFGIGYLLLVYLKRFLIGGVKIDRSFILEFEVLKENKVIVEGIILMVYKFDFKVVVEGVEIKR